MIIKKGSEYVIESRHNHKVLGIFKSRKKALKRLMQIEYFRRKSI